LQAWLDVIKVYFYSFYIYIYLITIKLQSCKTCGWHRFNILKFTDTLDELYSTAIATGARALTLQSQDSNIDPSFTDTSSLSQSLVTPLIRKRGRGQEDTPRLNKILKVDTGTSNRVVQMALAIEANMRSREGRLQEALDLLFEVYTSQLSQEDLDKAIDLIDTERKASFFVGLPEGDVRNCWLERHAGVQVIAQSNNEELDDYNRDELY
jgi:hypothetical protein